MLGPIFFIAFLGLEAFLVYDASLAMAAAVPEVWAVFCGLFICAIWAVQDIRRWLSGGRRRPRCRCRHGHCKPMLDEDGSLRW